MTIDAKDANASKPFPQEVTPLDFFDRLEELSARLGQAVGYDVGFKWQWVNMEAIERGTSLLLKLSVDKFMLESKTLSMASEATTRTGLPIKIQNQFANRKKALVLSLKDTLMMGENFYKIPEEKTRFLLRGSGVAATRLLGYSKDKNKLSTVFRETAADAYNMAAQLCEKTGGSPLDRMEVDKLTETIRINQDATQLLPIISAFSKNPPFINRS